MYNYLAGRMNLGRHGGMKWLKHIKVCFQSAKQGTATHVCVCAHNSLLLRADKARCSLPQPEHLVGQLANAIQSPHSYPAMQVIIYKLLSGLQHLHKGNVTHNDIKPENLIYDRDSR